MNDKPFKIFLITTKGINKYTYITVLIIKTYYEIVAYFLKKANLNNLSSPIKL